MEPKQQVEQLVSRISKLEAKRKVLVMMGELQPDPRVQFYEESSNGTNLLEELLRLRVRLLALLKLCQLVRMEYKQYIIIGAAFIRILNLVAVSMSS